MHHLLACVHPVYQCTNTVHGSVSCKWDICTQMHAHLHNTCTARVYTCTTPTYTPSPLGYLGYGYVRWVHDNTCAQKRCVHSCLCQHTVQHYTTLEMTPFPLAYLEMASQNGYVFTGLCTQSRCGNGLHTTLHAAAQHSTTIPSPNHARGDEGMWRVCRCAE